VKKFLRRRPSPATAIASIALFVSLGGVSYGFATGSIDSREIKNSTIKSGDVRNNTLRTEDIRNNEVRGRDIRNSTIRGQEIALNSLGGSDIKEANLGKVPDADLLDGLDSGAFQRARSAIPFSVRLQRGQTQTLASNGTVSIDVRCFADPPDDRVRILARTSSTTAVMEGTDVHGGTTGGFLTSFTPEGTRRLSDNGAPTGTTEVRQAVDGFVADPDGKGLHFSGESALLGLNYAGGDCYAAGLITPTG